MFTIFEINLAKYVYALRLILPHKTTRSTKNLRLEFHSSETRQPCHSSSHFLIVIGGVVADVEVAVAAVVVAVAVVVEVVVEVVASVAVADDADAVDVEARLASAAHRAEAAFLFMILDPLSSHD